MNIVMVQFKDSKRPGGYSKREYGYFSKVPLTVGDIIFAPTEKGKTAVRVSKIDVKESGIDVRIMPKMRTI